MAHGAPGTEMFVALKNIRPLPPPPGCPSACRTGSRSTPCGPQPQRGLQRKRSGTSHFPGGSANPLWEAGPGKVQTEGDSSSRWGGRTHLPQSRHSVKLFAPLSWFFGDSRHLPKGSGGQESPGGLGQERQGHRSWRRGMQLPGVLLGSGRELSQRSVTTLLE